MKELETFRAFILHTRDFKENQVLIEALVEGEGRLSLVGYKGSKKNSARNALFQPFRPIQIQFRKDAGLRKLVNIEADQSIVAESLLLTGKILFCGFYLNELVCRLCPADAQFYELYALYLKSVRQLVKLGQGNAQFNLELQLILRRFEFQLLNTLGYGLDLEFEAETNQVIQAESYYELLVEKGFVLSLNPNRAISGILLQQFKSVLMGAESVSNCGKTSNFDIKLVLATGKHILRQCLHRHLGDKPLKSRELFRTK